MFDVCGTDVLIAIRDHKASDVAEIVKVLDLPIGDSGWKAEASCEKVAKAVETLATIDLVTILPGAVKDRTMLWLDDPLHAWHLNNLRHAAARYDERFGEIRVTNRLVDIQKALGISLTTMALAQRPDVLAVRPLFGTPDERTRFPDVFVIMPFDEAFRPVYEDHIMPVAKGLGLSVGRADDFFTTHTVMRDVWSAIYAARIVIAECTGRNPNVFYEMGLAHTVGKPVVLTTQNTDDVPFDIRHYRYIHYSYTPRGMTTFNQQLHKTIDEAIRSRD